VCGGGGILRVRNTILANSLYGANVAGTIQDQGYNLSSDASLVVQSAGSRTSIDPGLDTVITSGVVPIIALATNSPAANAITAAGGNGCPTFDARNYLRVTPYDIGAYELDGIAGMLSLQATLQSNQLVISWPTANGFVLQSTSDVGSTNGWTAVTNSVSTVGSTQSVTLPPIGPGLFYRLRR
jgi:hypothetical protein